MTRDAVTAYCYCYHLRQGGYVFIGLVTLFFAVLRKNYSTDFHKIRWKGSTLVTEETVIRFR